MLSSQQSILDNKKGLFAFKISYNKETKRYTQNIDGGISFKGLI